MRCILILVLLLGFLVFAEVKPVYDGGVPLGKPLKEANYEPLIDPVTGEPLYVDYPYTKYAEMYENPGVGDLFWVEWDYNADSTQRVMRVGKGVSLHMKEDLLKKRFEKIKMRRKGKVKDNLYLKLEEDIKFPKYDLYLHPEMKEEFIKVATKNFFERRPYRIMKDTKGREILVTGQASPYVFSYTSNGKDTLIQASYEDTFYLDEIEKYGKIGEPILVHAVLGEIGDEVEVPLYFDGKVVAVAVFNAYGAEALNPKDRLRWDKYPFVDLEEGRELIEKEIGKMYADKENLPEIDEITYFGAGWTPFICDQRKEVADWASPYDYGGTASVCFVAALLSNGEVLFINPITKEVR
jgi:hypothetical protein